jgi:hypothetical protein
LLLSSCWSNLSMVSNPTGDTFFVCNYCWFRSILMVTWTNIPIWHNDY